MSNLTSECPTCGQPWVWSCRRCGSSERLKSGKGCAECHRRRMRAAARRRRERAVLEVDDSDIVVTPAIRAYLAAFDAYVSARRDGDTAAATRAEKARARLLAVIEGS